MTNALQFDKFHRKAAFDSTVLSAATKGVVCMAQHDVVHMSILHVRYNATTWQVVSCLTGLQFFSLSPLPVACLSQLEA